MSLVAGRDPVRKEIWFKVRAVLAETHLRQRALNIAKFQSLEPGANGFDLQSQGLGPRGGNATHANEPHCVGPDHHRWSWPQRAATTQSQSRLGELPVSADVAHRRPSAMLCICRIRSGVWHDHDAVLAGAGIRITDLAGIPSAMRSPLSCSLALSPRRSAGLLYNRRLA